MLLLAEDRNIKVTREAGEPVFVMGDRARLKQVVVNLLDNAVKYTLPGGSVHLKVHRDSGHGIIEIADTGVGIPPEAVPLVFERFFRVDRERSTGEGGRGPRPCDRQVDLRRPRRQGRGRKRCRLGKPISG
jgi:signal transduction histidine kinase